jgi:gamma-glutamylcyclotransferase (GGCT)/AIG2-like uncharacterized protein YtfP
MKMNTVIPKKSVFEFVQERILNNVCTPDMEELNEFDTQLFFMYGTFKNGHFRCDMLKELGGVFRNFAFTSDSNYRMYYNLVGKYPAVFEDQRVNPGRIFGEIWEVPTFAIPTLDNIESNGHLYQRKQVSLTSYVADPKTSSGDYHFCNDVWMYTGKPAAQRQYNWYDVVPRKSDLYGDYYSYAKMLDIKGLGHVATA